MPQNPRTNPTSNSQTLLLFNSSFSQKSSTLRQTYEYGGVKKQQSITGGEEGDEEEGEDVGAAIEPPVADSQKLNKLSSAISKAN